MEGNKLEVEVCLNFCVYRAFVEDVKPHELELSFERNWRPPCSIELKKIRFPPDGNDNAGFKENQLVEVQLKDAANKVSRWCKGILRKLDSSTGRWSVEYFTPDQEVHFSEVPMRKIRHINEKPTLGESTLGKVEIDIPQRLWEVAATPGIHDSFQKHVHADSCKFVPQTGVLRLISTNGELTRMKVNLLKEGHINYLKEWKSTSPPEEAANRCKIYGSRAGKKYANIKEARKIKDITSVKLIEDTLSLQVCGKTAEAVKTARNMLEYREHHSMIPRHLAEELLQNDGKIIAEITKQSGLVRIECGEDDDDDESEDYPVVFVGTPPCIENAKSLLEYQLKLIDRERKKREAAERESAALNDPNLYIERVPIKKELKGLAIGKNSENLKKAQTIPGIVKIDAPTEMPMIIIYAKNSVAAEDARRMLEYDEDTVEVDQNSLGKIIGKGGVTIKRIESLGEGVRVRIPSKVGPADLSSSGKVIIKVCGPAHKIRDTIGLIKRAESLGHL